MDKQNRKQLVDAYKERKKVGGVCAIVCSANGRKLLQAAPDLPGAKNKYAFFTATGACPEIALTKDWAQFGRDAFSFDVLEELEQKPEQSTKEFREDLNALMEMWREKIGAEELY